MEIIRDALAIIGGVTVIGALGLLLGIILEHPAVVQDEPEAVKRYEMEARRRQAGR